ncbi:MAG: Ig-like domain-containing protein, partial [Chloroflexota bacterium]
MRVLVYALGETQTKTQPRNKYKWERGGRVPAYKQSIGGAIFAFILKREATIRVALIAAILFNALTSNLVLAQSEHAREGDNLERVLGSQSISEERPSEVNQVESVEHSSNLSALQAPPSLIVSSIYYTDSIRTTLTQTASGNTLYVADPSGFTAGDEILVMTMQGTQAGQYETTHISTVGTDRLELLSALANIYDISLGPVMVQKVPYLGDVTVTSGGNITAHAWDGVTGGVVFFRADTVIVEIGGKISASGLGYRGGNKGLTFAFQGESPLGLGNTNMEPNSGGGGAGRQMGNNSGGGGGGGYGSNGENAGTDSGINYGRGGLAYGSTNLDNLYLGSGGGGGAGYASSSCGALGGPGGGVIAIFADSISVDGSMEANGLKGGDSPCDGGGGGGGSGGSIYLSASSMVFNTNTVTAIGGAAGLPGWGTWGGGAGGLGRVRLDSTNITGATDPEPGYTISGKKLSMTSDSPKPVGNQTPITVTIIVQNQDSLPVPNVPVELGILSGSSLYINNQSVNPNGYITIGNTNSSGAVTANLLTFTSGLRTIRARLKEQTIIGQEVTTEFLPGSISANMSDLSPGAASAPANGQSTINLTVTALDAYNNPIPNADVVWNVTGSAIVTPANQTTNSQGKATAQVVDSVVEQVTVSATIDGVLLNNQATLTFTGADMALSAATAPEALADSTLAYNIKVRNIGGITMQGVSLQVQLPDLVTYTSQTSPVVPVQNGQNLTWDFGTFAPGQERSFIVNGSISASAPLGSELTMQGDLTSTTTDVNLANNVATLTTTVVDGHDFTATILPASQSLGLGAQANYQISIKNTGLMTDQFTLSLIGLDTAWYTFANTTVSLLPGETINVPLTVQINSCEQSGNHTFQVAVTNTADQQVINKPASVTYQSGPLLSEFTPKENGLLGSQNVTFSWRSDVPSTGTLTVIGLSQTFSTTSGTFSSVVVPGLDRNSTYEWYVEAVSACGTTTSPQRQFTVGNGIVFTNRSQSISVDRDYDQRRTIAVKNEDTVNAHTLKVTVTDPYEDILVNFVDSGSQDQTITLQPNEIRQITLAIHTQDALLDTYDLSASLVADEESTPIYDNMNLHLTVLSDWDLTIEEDLDAFDELTLGRTFVITNNGKPVTDLSLNAIDPATGLPANIFLQPNVDHMRIETGQSVRVVAYPIFTADDAVAHANLLASIDSSLIAVTQANSEQASSGIGQFQLTSYSAGASDTLLGQDTALASSEVNLQLDAGDIDFDLIANGAGNTETWTGEPTSCGSNKQIIPVTMQDCTITFETEDWYCTNRPEINTPIQVPAFLGSSNIASAFLRMTFQPFGNVLDHSSQINFNNSLVGSFTNTVPNGQYAFNIPTSSWNNGIAGNVLQTVNLTSQHSNDAHYVSAAGYQLDVNVDQATTYVCADSQASAQQIVQSTYSCTASSSYVFNPLTDVFSGSVLNAGQNKTIIQAVVETDGNISIISCTTQEDCGDPINTHTGVFSFTLADMSFPTSAGELVFQRSYSTGALDTAGALGYGWTHNHEAKLIFPIDPGGMEGYVLFQSVLGNQFLFKIEADGSFTPGPGVIATLTKSTTSPITYTVTDSQQAVFQFDENGRLILRKDAQGREFDYEHNAQGQLTKVSADNGARYIQIGYDAQGRIVSVGNHANQQVAYGYNAAGDLVSATDVLGQTWAYLYDSGHRMTQSNDPAGKETVRNEYDGQGRVNRQYDGEGNLIVSIVYNNDGSTSVYNALGQRDEHQYNEHNIATQTVDPVGRTETKTFDANFRPIEITNDANQTLTMEWSADGANLLSKTDPAGNQTSYTYDSLNNLTSVTDPLNNTTTYTYNGKLLTSSTDALGGVTTYTYTPEGFLASMTDTAGRVT